MAENLDVFNMAVSLLIRAALLAARFCGRVRRRRLKRLLANVERHVFVETRLTTYRLKSAA